MSTPAYRSAPATPLSDLKRYHLVERSSETCPWSAGGIRVQMRVVRVWSGLRERVRVCER